MPAVPAVGPYSLRSPSLPGYARGFAVANRLGHPVTVPHAKENMAGKVFLDDACLPVMTCATAINLAAFKPYREPCLYSGQRRQ